MTAQHIRQHAVTHLPNGSDPLPVVGDIPLLFGAPDSANGYVNLISTSNLRLLVPAFTKSVDSQWWGIIDIPKTYNSGGSIVLWVAGSDGLSHASRWIVATKAQTTTSTWDAALTVETAQNVTMPTANYQPVAVTFTLSTQPVAGNSMVFYVERNGSNGADTNAADTFLFKAVFRF